MLTRNYKMLDILFLSFERVYPKQLIIYISGLNIQWRLLVTSIIQFNCCSKMLKKKHRARILESLCGPFPTSKSLLVYINFFFSVQLKTCLNTGNIIGISRLMSPRHKGQIAVQRIEILLRTVNRI